MLDYTKLVNLKEFANALSDLKDNIEVAQEAIAKAERTQSPIDHMQATMILSGCEIKMTNFANAIRRRFQ